MPVGHAVLLAHRRLDFYCFPFPEGVRVRGGLRLDLAQKLHRGLAPAQHHPSHDLKDAAYSNFGMEVCTDTARMLQKTLAREIYDADEDVLVALIDFFMHSRDQLLSLQHASGFRAYELSHLINCVVFAGHLRDSSNLRRAMVLAVKATLRSNALYDFYISLLNEPGQVPSVTTIQRHRRSLHLAWCLREQSRTQHVLQ